MIRALPALGAFGGVAWAASLRGYMAELAGPVSDVHWLNTFALILLPAAVVGAALGWAEAIRRHGGRRGWRWLAAAPLILPALALTPPGALTTFLTTGVGGGSIAMVLTGMIGGYAISGRGPRWGRIVAGLLTGAMLVLGAWGQTLVRPGLVVTEPRGAWVALLGICLSVILIAACSIPHRRVAHLSATQ